MAFKIRTESASKWRLLQEGTANDGAEIRKINISPCEQLKISRILYLKTVRFKFNSVSADFSIWTEKGKRAARGDRAKESARMAAKNGSSVFRVFARVQLLSLLLRRKRREREEQEMRPPLSHSPRFPFFLRAMAMAEGRKGDRGLGKVGRSEGGKKLTHTSLWSKNQWRVSSLSFRLHGRIFQTCKLLNRVKCTEAGGGGRIHQSLIE